MNHVKERKLSQIFTAFNIRLEGVDNHLLKKLEIGDFGCYHQHDIDENNSDESVNK